MPTAAAASYDANGSGQPTNIHKSIIRYISLFAYHSAYLTVTSIRQPSLTDEATRIADYCVIPRD
jgi:hypothetical protein